MTKRRDQGSELEAFTSDLAPSVRRGKGLGGMIGSAPPASIERGTDTDLSPSEVDALTHAEAIIERGLKTFFEVGSALIRIRDLELYRIEHRTFEAYCADRWGMSRPRAYELMNASQVVSAIADTTTEQADFQMPQNEAQARPLTRLKDPAQQREAWERAVTTSPGRITAAHVEQIVKDMLAQAAPVSAAPSVDEHEAAPAQQEVIIEQAGEDGMFPDGEPAPAAPASAPDAAPLQGDWLHLAVQTDEEEDAATPSGEEEPWPDNLFEIEARLAEEGWERTSESETRIYYQRGDETLHLVKPPEPNVVQLRLVAHASEDMEQVMTWLHQQIGAEFPRRPASSRLPKYPERRRVYGLLDLNTKHLDQVAGLQAELAKSQAAHRQVMDILHEYQEQITRAQKYKPTSDKGEAVSPLLRLVERVALTIQDIERKGGQKG